VAGRRIVIVIKTVIPQQFLPGLDASQSKYPHAVLNFVHLAVGFTGMIEEGSQSLAINHCLAIFHPVQVRAGGPFIKPVGLLRTKPGTHIFNDARAFSNRRGGKNTCCMDAGRTYYESHPTNFARRSISRKTESSITLFLTK
jgi:hypothetical protein